MGPLLTLEVWTSQPVEEEKESGLFLESFALERKPLEQRFVNSKEVVIHQALIHHPSIHYTPIHYPSTHHALTTCIDCTCFPSRQTALMVVSGHQTLSNLKRIKVQQLQNKSSHQCWFTYFLFLYFFKNIIKHGQNSKLCPSVPLFLLWDHNWTFQYQNDWKKIGVHTTRQTSYCVFSCVALHADKDLASRRGPRRHRSQKRHPFVVTFRWEL